MYNTSRDYEKLYSLIKDGKEVVGWVDYEVGGSIRQVCQIRQTWGVVTIDSFRKDFSAIMEHDPKEKFISECQRLNLEWIVPKDDVNLINEIESMQLDSAFSSHYHWGASMMKEKIKKLFIKNHQPPPDPNPNIHSQAKN